jgi:GntR family transcriptional regulator
MSPRTVPSVSWPSSKAIIARRESAPLHSQIANLIRDDIEDGRLQPGDRLPPEAQLADHFGLSVAPVRQALLSLVNESYLERRQGDGTFVLAKVVAQVSMLSGLTEADAAHLSGAELEVLSQQVKRSKDALGQLCLAGQKVFMLRRIARIGATPVALLSEYLDPLRFPGIDRLKFRGRSLYRTLAELYGTRVTSSACELDLVRASRDEAVLKLAPASLLLRVTSTTYAEDEVIEHAEILYRTEGFRLQFESLNTPSGVVKVPTEAADRLN